MMYKIDLLEGRGLPPKSQPGRIAAAASSFIIPLLILAAGGRWWMQNRTLLISNAAACSQQQKQIQRFHQDLQQYQQNQNKKSQMENRLKKISEELHYEMQFAPILQDLVGILPPVLTIEELKLKYNPGRQRVIDKINNQAKFVSVVNRSLHIWVLGPDDSTSDQAVKQYVENLRRCPSLVGRFQSIQVASRQEIPDNQQERFLYEIECLFQEQKKP